MSIYLPKECLSAERLLGRRTEYGDLEQKMGICFVGFFCKMDALTMLINIMDVQKEVLLQKEGLSADTQKGDLNTETVSAEFLPKLSAEIRHFGHFGRPLVNTLTVTILGLL